MSVSVETPRINANEDQLQVIEIRVTAGDHVEKGETLFVLETTKAAIEVNAPEAGTIESFSVNVGNFVDVGSILCRITNAARGTSNEGSIEEAETKRDVKITAKARKLAEELGVDLAGVKAVNGRVGEAEVQAAAHAGKTVTAAQSPSPQKMAVRNNARRAVIIGGGGHAACLIDALQGSGYQILGCTDETLPTGEVVCAGIKVIGKSDCLERLRDEGVSIAFVGVGGATSSTTRRKIYERAVALGFQVPTIIHPSATVSLDCHIGDGCHILAGATIGPRCIVGNDVIVNQGSIVCHDSVIEDHAHLAPGCVLAGSVRVGTMTVVGMAVTVLFKTSVGANVLIHNGAHIMTDVADDMIVDGQGKRHSKT